MEREDVAIKTKTDILLRHWWLPSLRGAIAVAFGLATLMWPALTLLTLAALFGAFALVGGAVWTFAALENRAAETRWWALLLLGLFSLAAGAIAMLYPALTTVVLIMLVGANALVSGIMDVIVAVRLRKYVRNEWLLVLSGVGSALFGVLVLLFPLGAGALALAWWIGLYALLMGLLLIALSWRLRSWTRLRPGQSSPATGAL